MLEVMWLMLLLLLGTAPPARAAESPLSAAARAGDEVLVRALLSSGAKDLLSDGWSALTWAAVKGHLEILDILLTEAAYEKTELDRGLLRAVGGRQGEAVQRLLVAGADANATNEDGVPVLFIAIEDTCTRDMGEGFGAPRVDARALAVAKALLEGGADVNAVAPFALKEGGADVKVGAPLALCHAHPPIFEFLLRRGAKVEGVVLDGLPLVEGAWRRRSWEVVALLVEMGHQAPDPSVLAAAAANHGRWKTVETLLDRGLDPDQVDVGQRPLLVEAVETGPVGLVAQLLAHGADPARQGEHVYGTVYLAAIQRGDADALIVLGQLLDAGASPCDILLAGAAIRHPDAGAIRTRAALPCAEASKPRVDP